MAIEATVSVTLFYVLPTQKQETPNIEKQIHFYQFYSIWSIFF